MYVHTVLQSDFTQQNVSRSFPATADSGASLLTIAFCSLLHTGSEIQPVLHQGAFRAFLFFAVMDLEAGTPCTCAEPGFPRRAGARACRCALPCVSSKHQCCRGGNTPAGLLHAPARDAACPHQPPPMPRAVQGRDSGDLAPAWWPLCCEGLSLSTSLPGRRAWQRGPHPWSIRIAVRQAHPARGQSPGLGSLPQTPLTP